MNTAADREPDRSASTHQSRRALNHLFGEYERARAERDSAEQRLSRFAETIQLLISGLPSAEQSELAKRFRELRDGAQQRGGQVFNNVVSLFKRDQRTEWTIPEIQAELEKSGDAPEPKAVSNAVTYLTKIGKLRRVGRGQYIVEGFFAGIQMEGPEDGTLPGSEHDV